MPDMKLKVDMTGLAAKIARAKSTKQMRREAVIGAAEVVVRAALILASEHKDTGRYMAALAEAGNASGVGQFPVSPIGPSRMQERLLAILVAQVRRWKRLAVLRAREGRTGDKSMGKIRANIAKAEEQLERFQRGARMGAIVVDAFSSVRMATVRVNFSAYGGDGRVITVGDETLVRIHIKEPHASIVESRFGIMRRALAQSPLKKIAKKALKEQMVRAGFTSAA
ncbi:MAG: hypothetical protein JSS51_03565 [Planctomycetes bacterium]|nr:hypothetical protein [Planctomycetota bacterium]